MPRPCLLPGLQSALPGRVDGHPRPQATYVVVVLDGLPREVEHGARHNPLTEEVSDLKVRG